MTSRGAGTPYGRLRNQSSGSLMDVVQQLEEMDPDRGQPWRTTEYVAAFIAGLFLVHRRVADVVQDVVGPIHVVDLWPTPPSEPILSGSRPKRACPQGLIQRR